MFPLLDDSLRFAANRLSHPRLLTRSALLT